MNDSPVLESLRDRTHPWTVTVVPTAILSASFPARIEQSMVAWVAYVIRGGIVAPPARYGTLPRRQFKDHIPLSMASSRGM